MSILDDNSGVSNAPAGLRVTGEMKRNWMIISKWALFFAILGFIWIGFSLLTIGSMGAIMQTMLQLTDNPLADAIVPLMSYVTILSVGVMAVMFFIHFYHLRFSNKIQKAINFTDQTAFVSAWQNLRNHFRLYGITVCVLIGIYLIALILIGSIVASSGLPTD